MNNQLSNISTQYRKFSKGQYIEHTQFNEFLDFFEDQDRLSRVMLQGVGVVCGFKPQLIYANRVLNNIQLSQGVAITTDGDLLTLNNTSKVSDDLYISDLKTINIKNKQYTHFKAYDDYKVKYPAFHDGGKQIDLWELATSSEAKSGFQPIASLNNLEDKYLLLYLENYEKEVKPCRGVDCDNHGIQQIRNLKVLVTTREGVNHIFKNDKIYPHPTLSGLGSERRLKRVILEPKATSVDNLIQAYKEVTINESGYGSMFRDIEFISAMINVPTVDREIFIERLNNLSSQDKGFQYAYDIIKDLFDTYTEIIRLLPKSFTKCLPDLLSFPKHIMLGKLISDTKLDYTRHQFYNSPILDSEKIAKRVRLLIERFNQQTLQFKNPSDIENNGVKITPSQELCPLGDEAIPFYYDLTEDFLKAWNFDKTSNRTSNTNLSFDTTLLSEDLHIQNPMSHNIDKKPFYHIEGHQGMDYQTAVKNIREIKDKLQLGFDVMALSLEELIGNKDLSKAYFTEYVEKHPGLEHRGGVGRGGTFGVVYASENDRTVIADFSLPYLCCTPKSDVRLSLPSSTICKDAKSVSFTVSPANGTVEASVGQGLNGGVEIINGQYLFNPKIVSPSLYNQEITFTVNGKATNCVIKVLPQPNIQVNLNAIAYPEGGSNTTTVTFVVSGANFATYDYSWDFLGNGSYVTLKPNAKGNVTYTYYNLDVKRIPVIQVQISSNGCSQNIILRDWYVPQSVEINKLPVANAGTDQAIKLPINTVSLDGSSSSDSDGNVVSYLWKEISGSTANITDPTAVSTTVTELAEGTYTFELTVTDDRGGVSSDTMTVVVAGFTKASVKSVSISPTSPDTRTEIIATANVSNPDNIGELVYNWYLNGKDMGTTTTNSKSFGMLASGTHTIMVRLVGSTGNNHSTTSQSINFTVKSVQTSGGSSFLAGTLIRMADGSLKKVEEIELGDALRGSQDTVNVVDMSNYESNSKVYRLNEEEYFITAEHPIMTDGGWKSFDPDKSKELVPSITVSLLVRNDVLVKDEGKRVTLDNTDFIEGSNLVYNFSVDKTNDFYANGYLVHNKIELAESDPR